MKVLIIEDETAAALNLRALLGQYYPHMEIIASMESIADSVEWFEQNSMPELVFMDIHLADGNAFNIFDKVEINCPIIFTTAYDQYALDAFKVNSIDYLLKPIKESDLQHAITKLSRLSTKEKEEYTVNVSKLMHKQNEAQTFLVRIKDKIVPLKSTRIAYCYTINEKVTACTYEGQNYPLDKTLETIAGMLPEDDFYRANRQFIIARTAIKDISVWFGSRLSVNLSVEAPEKIIISKARVPEFKMWLAGSSK